jgi:hypothetical protein
MIMSLVLQLLPLESAKEGHGGRHYTTAPLTNIACAWQGELETIFSEPSRRGQRHGLHLGRARMHELRVPNSTRLPINLQLGFFCTMCHCVVLLSSVGSAGRMGHEAERRCVQSPQTCRNKKRMTGVQARSRSVESYLHTRIETVSQS